MGMLVQVLCHCGYYDSELTLAVGSGFKGIEAEQEGIPACCEVCHEVVLAADSHSPECPRCGNRVALYSDFTMYSSDFPHGDPSGPEPVAVRLRYTGKVVTLPGEFYKCPRCGEYRMRFYQAGNWD